MLTEKTHKRIIWTAFAVCVLTSNPSTAKETDEACQLALESVQALFQPNYDLAITRGTYQSNLPEKTIKYTREESNHDFIKYLGMNLESDLPSAQAVARSNLLYFLRFGKTVSVRKSAFVELSRSKDFKHLVDQVIAARVYEQDPAFRRWLDATVERVIPEHEAYRKANWTPMPREWLNETQLPAGDKERLWKSVENGYSYRNPLEIHARVEQIPAEIEWLEKLRTLAPTSAAAQTVYENAVNTVKARRKELADRLYDDEILNSIGNVRLTFWSGEPRAKN